MTKAQLIEAIQVLNPEATGLGKLRKADLELALEVLQHEADNADDEELNQAQRMSKKLREARVRYTKTVASSGNASADNDDSVATALRGMDPRDVVAAAERVLGLTEGELWAKYESLNPGQQRMNAGNRIRGAIKRGDVEVDAVLKQLH